MEAPPAPCQRCRRARERKEKLENMFLLPTTMTTTTRRPPGAQPVPNPPVTHGPRQLNRLIHRRAAGPVKCHSEAGWLATEWIEPLFYFHFSILPAPPFRAFKMGHRPVQAHQPFHHGGFLRHERSIDLVLFGRRAALHGTSTRGPTRLRFYNNLYRSFFSFL